MSTEKSRLEEDFRVVLIGSNGKVKSRRRKRSLLQLLKAVLKS